jgi:hypothetical protein
MPYNEEDILELDDEIEEEFKPVGNVESEEYR